MLTSDNKELNKVAEKYTQAIKATNAALEADLSDNQIEALEDKEDAAKDTFLAFIHNLLPASVLSSITNIRLYNAKIIDTYIMPHV
jgi:hypothetical protein